MNFIEYFLNLANAISLKSKDQSTKVGALVAGPDNEIRSTGYNGFPRGMNDNLAASRQKRPLKYKYYEHAERNVIYNAARVGVPLKGCDMYITHPPCPDCARAIIQAGINKVVFPAPTSFDTRKDLVEDNKLALNMLVECKIVIIRYSQPTQEGIRECWVFYINREKSILKKYFSKK